MTVRVLLVPRLRVPQEALIPLTARDERKLQSLRSRPYLTCQPEWEREVRRERGGGNVETRAERE